MAWILVYADPFDLENEIEVSELLEQMLLRKGGNNKWMKSKVVMDLADERR